MIVLNRTEKAILEKAFDAHCEGKPFLNGAFGTTEMNNLMHLDLLDDVCEITEAGCLFLTQGIEA